MRKIRVGILLGGRSAEHEVSLQSAKNVIEAIDRNKYEPVPIGITKKGEWVVFDDSLFLQYESDPAKICLLPPKTRVSLTPWKSNNQLVSLSSTPISLSSLDVVFPILHGPFGEDGTIQGLLKLMNIPFVGASVLGSAVGMDKDVMKRLLRDGNIPITPFEVVYDHQKRKISYKELSKKFGKTLFVKPANLGSSVGVSKASNEKEFTQAIQNAFLYDRKILIESFVKGREIECAILGNEDPKASALGEIIPQDDFYSYKAKYIDENGALLKVPAELSQKVVSKIQTVAIQAFQILGCEGMARVDFFLTDKNEIIVNEINTIPGFTKISMYPKLWEASGISYTSLINKLITLAIERHRKEQILKTTQI